MLAYRGLFLAAAISSAGIAFADVIVQPNYQYQGDEQGYPHQVVHQQQERVPKQVINQPYATGIHTIYPYQARSPLVGYPAHHYYHSLPHRLHIAKIGGRDHVRPSLYIGYRPNSVVHHHRKRSAEPTVDETGATENNAVATKSSLSTHPIDPVIDPHLTNDQSIDTNDKHVKNRQSKDVRAVKPPLLLGLYPDGMRQVSSTYLPKKLSFVGEHSNEESTANSVKPILSETTQQMVPTNSQDKMAYSENDGQRIKELTNMPNSIEMISTSKARSPFLPDNFYIPSNFYDDIYDTYDTYDPMPDLYDYPPIDPYVSVDPYLEPYPYLRMNSHSTVDPYLNTYATNPNYPIYKYQNSGARSNMPLIMNTAQTSPYMLQVHQLSSAGNWPGEVRYYALS